MLVGMKSLLWAGLDLQKVKSTGTPADLRTVRTVCGCSWTYPTPCLNASISSFFFSWSSTQYALGMTNSEITRHSGQDLKAKHQRSVISQGTLLNDRVRNSHQEQPPPEGQGADAGTSSLPAHVQHCHEHQLK